MEFKIALLPGDYVGPEVVAEAVKVVDAVAKRFGHVFNWHEDYISGASIDKYGVALRSETIKLCKQCDAVLYGAGGGPKWEKTNEKNPADAALPLLRRALGLFANIRPVKVLPALINDSTLKPEVINGVDLIILRELIGGLYFAEPKGITQTPQGRQAVNTMFYTEAEIERIIRTGFELARTRRKKLLSVEKSAVLDVSFLWRQIAVELAPQYPDVELTHMNVDAAAMYLIRNPKDIDVMVTENTFGDILSDEASMISGSMGMMPSASLSAIPIGRVFGLYEPIHGSDPARAGKDMDNPLATILSAAMMLRYSCGLEEAAETIEAAVNKVIEQGYRTWDIMGDGNIKVGTRQMGDLVVQEIMK